MEIRTKWKCKQIVKTVKGKKSKKNRVLFWQRLRVIVGFISVSGVQSFSNSEVYSVHV